MTPERTARLVGRWVRWYTRRLPAPVAGRRAREIEADVHAREELRLGWEDARRRQAMEETGSARWIAARRVSELPRTEYAASDG
ncbi:MAG TPA: hypothetical protein VFY23_14480 [Candidatus Limnocylindrales bacterium]|nr:hypothetical protein [Candidatus Limnocylindrales bacterium]